MSNEQPLLAKRLQEHFAPEDIEWKVQSCGFTKDGKPWAMVLAYITNRAIQARLDDTVGPLGWENEFTVNTDGAITCRLSIYSTTLQEWVSKEDAADPTDIEAIKGGRSSAMKRAGTQWGIGRYLYKLETNFAECQLERPKDKKGVHQGKDKTGRKFYWKEPQLPEWALPGGKA